MRVALSAPLRPKRNIWSGKGRHLLTLSVPHRYQLIPGEDGSYGLSISNYGRSPAYLDFYSFTHHWYPADRPLPKDFREHEYSQIQAVINRILGPGKQVTITKPEFAINVRLTEQERTGHRQAIFRGSVTYDDVFMFGKVQDREERHHTELVYRYDVASGRLVNLPPYNSYT